mgnify:FL=1
MKVLHYPLTQITFFFVFGIVFNRYLNVEFNTGLIFLVGSFSVFIMLFLLNYRSKSIHLQKLFTVVCLILSFSIGNFSAIIGQDTNDENHYTHSENLDDFIDMKVILKERWK